MLVPLKAYTCHVENQAEFNVDDRSHRLKSVEERLVSPLKIVNQNSVQKAKRPASDRSVVKADDGRYNNNNDSEDDADSEGSPSKRSRKHSEKKNLLDSPVTVVDRLSTKRRASIRKNLNESFLADEQLDAGNDGNHTYTIEQSDTTMKIKIKGAKM